MFSLRRLSPLWRGLRLACSVIRQKFAFDAPKTIPVMEGVETSHSASEMPQSTSTPKTIPVMEGVETCMGCCLSKYECHSEDYPRYGGG